MAIDKGAHGFVQNLLEAALYKGPFSELHLGPYYWTERVDDILLSAEDSLSPDLELESPGERNRKLAELLIGQSLPLDDNCPRCHGKNGGFLCPFSDRTVCQRADCSVVSNAWIPAGARLSRFERGFYDEWAPILGM